MWYLQTRVEAANPSLEAKAQGGTDMAMEMTWVATRMEYREDDNSFRFGEEMNCIGKSPKNGAAYIAA